MDLHLSKGLKNVIFPPKVSYTHNYESHHYESYLILDSGDLVVGVVTHKHPEYYRVDINAPELATLR